MTGHRNECQSDRRLHYRVGRARPSGSRIVSIEGTVNPVTWLDLRRTVAGLLTDATQRLIVVDLTQICGAEPETGLAVLRELVADADAIGTGLTITTGAAGDQFSDRIHADPLLWAHCTGSRQVNWTRT